MANELELLCPTCRRKYGAGTNGPSFFAKHVATCKGPQATVSPRAKATETDPPQARSAKRKRSAVPREKDVEHTSRQRGGQSRSRSAERLTAGAAISPAAFIAALRAKRDKIEAAIAAVEALA